MKCVVAFKVTKNENQVVSLQAEVIYDQNILQENGMTEKEFIDRIATKIGKYYTYFPEDAARDNYCKRRRVKIEENRRLGSLSIEQLVTFKALCVILHTGDGIDSVEDDPLVETCSCVAKINP